MLGPRASKRGPRGKSAICTVLTFSRKMQRHQGMQTIGAHEVSAGRSVSQGHKAALGWVEP